jgi:hypothetical protein
MNLIYCELLSPPRFHFLTFHLKNNSFNDAYVFCLPDLSFEPESLDVACTGMAAFSQNYFHYTLLYGCFEKKSIAEVREGKEISYVRELSLKSQKIGENL